MDLYSHLNEINKNLDFYRITDEKFATLGSIIDDFDFSRLIEHMRDHVDIPVEGNVYVGSCVAMEDEDSLRRLRSRYYEDSLVQIGYCNGRNSTLNGLEYHEGSEIFVAVTDLVLLLGNVDDLIDGYYDIKNISAFFIPEGTCLQIYSTTLHFSPCKVSDSGFKSIIILLRETNDPLPKDGEERNNDRLLFAKNKWLIAHPDRKVLIEKGAFAGIVGENIEVIY